jgi:hypothetical protein
LLRYVEPKLAIEGEIQQVFGNWQGTEISGLYYNFRTGYQQFSPMQITLPWGERTKISLPFFSVLY